MYKNKKLTVINEELERSVEQIKFLHGKIYTRVDDTGKSDVREFDPVTSTFHKIFETASSVIDYTVTETGDVYFTATDDLKIWAVWKWTPNGVELVDDPNKDGLSSKQLVEAEEMWFTNPEGVKFHGWYFDASKVSEGKPGLVLSIHGGPHAMWTNGGTMFHEWQSTVSAGYSVLALNPIGSQGYGQDYSQLIVPAKWGLDDARDLLAAVDQVSERVDTNRLYITGGSYAGFQTANIISRDHRFKAAVAQRGVYNFVNFGFVTDIPLWFGYEMGGTPYEKLTELWDISPLGRAHEIETPLLIIHAENDFRVPISEAESLFTALKLQDKEVVLVRYPRDGHELSRSGEPIHVVDRIKRMLEWFESHP
jgi:dipeptidyl aminopeptidase/acylaminoacyl peptidase